MLRIPFVFPEKGFDGNANYPTQSPATTSDADNVAVFDALKQRRRGGRRGGLSKFVPSTINGVVRIQHMSKAVQAFLAAEVEAEEILVATGLNTNNSPTTSMSAYSLAGVVQIALQQGSQQIHSADKDLYGNYYVANAETTSVPTKFAPTASDGTVTWSGVAASGVNRRCVFNPVYNTLIADINPEHLIVSYDAATGTRTVGFVDFTMLGSGVSALEIDEDGNIWVLNSVSKADYGGETGQTPAALFKLHGRTGALLAQWGRTNTSEQNFIGFHIKGSEIIVNWAKAAGISDYDGAGSTANIFIFNKDMVLQTTLLAVKPTANSGGEVIHPMVDSNGKLHLAWASGWIVEYNNTTALVEGDKKRIMAVPGWVGNPITSAKMSSTNRICCAVTPRSDYNGTGANQATILVWAANTQVDNNVDWYKDTVGQPEVYALRINPGRPATLATRRTRLSVVAAGDIYLLEGDDATAVTSGDNVLVTTPHAVQSVNAFSQMFYVDGENMVKMTLSNDTAATWVSVVPNATSLPGHGTSIRPRLIARYRGRIVLAGMASDPNNWFMSRVGDPYDWDYSPSVVDALMPVAGNIGETGLFGDIITALIPYDDDLLVVGMDQSIGLMAGDPAAGGSIDVISNDTGMAWNAWALDPNDNLYFMGVDGIYVMPRNGKPESITLGRLDSVFESIDMEKKRVHLTWDYLRRGLIVIIADTLSSVVNEVWFYEQRTDGWFPWTFPVGFGPDEMFNYDAEKADDKATLLACRDGFIRRLDPDATDDDGTAIASNVRFFPISTRKGTDTRLFGLEIVLAEDSGEVTLKLYTGQTAEQCAITTAVRWSRTLKAGRNVLTLPRLSGLWLQMEFTSTARWGLESVFGLFEEGGRSRRLKQ